MDVLNSLKWDDNLSKYMLALAGVVNDEELPELERAKASLLFWAVNVIGDLQHAEDRGEVLRNLESNPRFRLMMIRAADVRYLMSEEKV